MKRNTNNSSPFKLFLAEKGADATREFEDYYRQNYPRVYNYAYYRLLDHAAAEDVTSEAFLKAARNFSRFDPDIAAFSTWIIAITRNCLSDYYRKKRPTVQLENVPESKLAINEDYPSLDATAQEARRLIALLENDEREIVFLKYFEDMRNKDIARTLNMNPSTVATKLSRAIAKMKKAATEEALHL